MLAKSVVIPPHRNFIRIQGINAAPSGADRTISSLHPRGITYPLSSSSKLLSILDSMRNETCASLLGRVGPNSKEPFLFTMNEPSLSADPANHCLNFRLLKDSSVVGFAISNLEVCVMLHV